VKCLVHLELEIFEVVHKLEGSASILGRIAASTYVDAAYCLQTE